MDEVTQVSDHAPRSRQDSTPDEPDVSLTIEAYETEDGVVFYDADNPLAWLEATRTVSLEEFA